MFGLNIKQFRGAAGMSQAVLALKVGVTQQTISNWENGMGEPSASELLALSVALNVDLKELLTKELVT